MADETTETKKRPPALERAEVVSYFKNVGAKDSCPICDYAGWYVFTKGENGVIKLEYEESATYLPCIVMVCKNCNFIRLHSKRLIEDAVHSSEDKRKPDGA